jgi:16S rRNA G1207 methylase RsmC
VGLFIKALHPEQAVWLSDINDRAVEYTRRNADQNKLNVNVISSDLYSAFDTITFDDIVTNPPIASGKKMLTRLIMEASDHLSPNGCLWLVAFHNKGGSTLKEIMKTCFGNVEDMEKSGGIRVYRSSKTTV